MLSIVYCKKTKRRKEEKEIKEQIISFCRFATATMNDLSVCESDFFLTLKNGHLRRIGAKRCGDIIFFLFSCSSLFEATLLFTAMKCRVLGEYNAVMLLNFFFKAGIKLFLFTY
eukprot:TRINITY_DN407_c1_g1_i1.p1 TRINITY_DN407_c1_g1~~TRINITY_DN407_c1_g1_i1.p1  ORF type:complete len:114 (-),score=6.61 TRINITY_DN407_c1_g1_i1:165-506(-)